MEIDHMDVSYAPSHLEDYIDNLIELPRMKVRAPQSVFARELCLALRTRQGCSSLLTWWIGALSANLTPTIDMSSL
jgi:hypothetical protein